MLLAPFLWIFCEFDEKVLDNLSLGKPERQLYCYACQCIEQSAKIRGGNSDGFVISLQTNKDI